MPGFLLGIESGSQSGPSSRLETARAHRWEVTFADPPFSGAADELRFYAHSVSRPNFQLEQMTMHNRQNEIHLPGKSKFGTVDLCIYERVRESGEEVVDAGAEMVRKWWSDFLMDAKRHSLNMGNNINNIKRRIRTTLLDGCGEVIWGYLMVGCFPIKVEPTALAYEDSSLATISVVLSIDSFQEGVNV